MCIDAIISLFTYLTPQMNYMETISQLFHTVHHVSADIQAHFVKLISQGH